jgi:hypothetical protein
MRPRFNSLQCTRFSKFVKQKRFGCSSGLPIPLCTQLSIWTICATSLGVQPSLPTFPLQVQWTIPALQRVARTIVGKAAGPDNWTSDSLLLLPDAWWSAFAQLWDLFFYQFSSYSLERCSHQLASEAIWRFKASEFGYCLLVHWCKAFG